MADDTRKSDDYSFESILAEVKSSAFIDGDKKTPSHILEAEAERIIREAAGLEPDHEIEREVMRAVNMGETPQTPASEQAPEPAPTQEPPQTPTLATENTAIKRSTPDESPELAAERLIYEAYEQFEDADVFRKTSEPEFAEDDEKPIVVTPREDEEQLSSESRGAPERIPAADDTPIFDIPLDDDSADSSPTIIRERPSKTSKEKDISSLFEQVTIPEDEQMGVDYEEEVIEEPRLKNAAVGFLRQSNSVSLRLLPAAIITIIMVLITYVFDAGLLVPFGIGQNLDYAAGTLVLCLLIVMMLCVEVLIRGVDFLMDGKPNAESLILFSCVFSIISASFTMLSGTALMLPFCAVSALSLIFAAYGERLSMRAMSDTLRTAISTAEPYGVQAEYNNTIDKSVLKKAYNRTDGLYTNLMQEDISEILYRFATPILLIAALALAIVITLVNGAVENAFHVLSALLAAAVPFSALLSFAVPFGIVAKSLRKDGVALAGWGGADDIFFTNGVCVTDDDLFPPGTLSLGAVKVYDNAPPNNVMCYTASLIIASGSGLTSLFAEVLKQQGITALRVANFEYQESGIKAIIQGHQVATGSAAYMNLIGVRVPDDVNMKNAIFTAVNDRLVGMFAIEYKPLLSVQNALISMLKWRIDLFFAMRDFNITPAMVGQKFKVPFEGFVFVSVDDSYRISDPYSGKQGRMASVLTREGLGPYAEAVTSGRLLRSASLLATIMSLASAALGILVMFLMCWGGTFISATPGNLIIFMLCMLAVVMIVCGYVRLRK